MGKAERVVFETESTIPGHPLCSSGIPVIKRGLDHLKPGDVSYPIMPADSIPGHLDPDAR